MKVLHCIPSMAGGGAERQLTYLSQGLVALGIETHVALTQPGENQERLARSGAVLHEILIGNNHSPALPIALHRLIGRLQPDIVQTWLTQMDIVGGGVALLHRIPWVVTERNSAARYSRGMKDRLRLRLGRRAAALIANSSEGVKYWDAHLPPGTPRHVISNGLPFADIKDARPLSAAESPATLDDQLIVFAGRLHSAKNVDGLIRALGRLQKQRRFKAVLFGQGPEQAKLESLLESSGLSKLVSLRGYSPCLWSWMKRADAFVSVSFSEGQPNTVMEAMAARCPLVVSDIPEHREFLDPTRAWLVSPSDSDAIADALLECLRDRKSAVARADAASRHAARWSIESMSRQYQAVYEQLTHRQAAALGNGRSNRRAAESAPRCRPLASNLSGRRHNAPAEAGSPLDP